MSKIVAVTGVLADQHGAKRIAGAGKDEVAKIFVDHHYIAVAFADIMKRFCQELFSFTESQLWGPSEQRVSPDKRYPAGGEYTREVAIGVKIPVEYLAPCLTPRFALQTLGDWGRGCQPDIWANYTLQLAKELLEGGYVYSPRSGLESEYGHKDCPQFPYKGVVIPDMRFQNEFRRVKEEGGKVVRVVRYCEEFPTKMDDSHISERDILEWGNDVFDHVIENVGDLERLRSDTEKLIALL